MHRTTLNQGYKNLQQITQFVWWHKHTFFVELAKTSVNDQNYYFYVQT